MEYICETNNKDIIQIQVRQTSNNLVTRLVEVRKSMNMTQQDIADKTGMERANIARIESKKYTPTIDVLVRYAACLGMDIDFVLKEK